MVTVTDVALDVTVLAVPLKKHVDSLGKPEHV